MLTGEHTFHIIPYIDSDVKSLMKFSFVKSVAACETLHTDEKSKVKNFFIRALEWLYVILHILS